MLEQCTVCGAKFALGLSQCPHCQSRHFRVVEGDPPSPPPSAPFDPDEHTVPEVLDHLADSDEAEVERVLEAELDGQARKGVLALLDEPEVDDAEDS